MMTEEAKVEENPTADKKKLWAITVNADSEDVKYNVSAKTVNAALSKASKYKKDHGMETDEITEISCMAVINY